MSLMDRAPNLSNIGKESVSLLISKGDDMANGRMSLEEGSYAFVEHKVNLGIREVLPQGAEQWRGQNGIAHLSEADYEYLHIISFMVVSL